MTTEEIKAPIASEAKPIEPSAEAQAPKPAKAAKKATPSFVPEEVIAATFGVNTAAQYLWFNALGHAFFTKEAAEASVSALDNKKVQRIDNPLKP